MRGRKCHSKTGSKPGVLPESDTNQSNREGLVAWMTSQKLTLRLKYSGQLCRPASDCYLKLVGAPPGVAMFDLPALAASCEDG